MFRFFPLLLACCVLNALAADSARPAPHMDFLDNGEVRIGMDLALGGAVTFLSSKDHPANIINSADLGRQIQMSHYSGPWPFEVGDKKPSPTWAGLGWNPIQTGDCYMNPSKVVEHRNDGKELYIRCIPMQWPLNNMPGDCVFETWTTLDGNVVHMRYRCTNQRLDKTFYRPCSQELPAVYTISKLWRLMAYTGERPFSNDALTHVTNDYKKPWPWTRFIATERWAALVDDSDWGLGVFKEDGGEFHGGIYGEGRSDDPQHGSTAYVAPIQVENFDHNIVYDHRTEFVIGNLAEIRKRCNQMASKSLPAWQFARDRQHWIVRDAVDQGFPLNGEWRIRLGDKIPRLESASRSWRADTAPGLDIEVAYRSPGASASEEAVKRSDDKKGLSVRVYWKRLDDDQCTPKKSLVFVLPPDGKYHRQHLDLASSSEYRGLIIGLAMDLGEKPQPGEEISIKSITLTSPANR